MDLLIRYPWPGNVRELINTIGRAVVLAQSACLDENDFDPLTLRIPESAGPLSGDGFPADMPLEQIEREAILNTLASANGI